MNAKEDISEKATGTAVDLKDICEEFRYFCYRRFGEYWGVQKDIAEHYNVGAAFISAVMYGKRPPTENMLRDMGYTKEYCYRKVARAKC